MENKENNKVNNMFGNEESIEATIKKLRKIAKVQMQKTGYVNKYNTFQPTALAHEIFIKLQQNAIVTMEADSDDFYKYCTMMIKNFLFDHMRKKRAQKGGGDLDFISIDQTLDIAWAWEKNRIQPQDFLDLQEALDKFRLQFTLQSQIIEAKYFLGMKDREIAEWLDICLSKVEKDVKFAKGWLRRELLR